MQDEETLLRQLRDKSTREKAFTRLMYTHQEQLYWAIRRIVLTHENADDVLQNVFAKAWQGIDDFRGDSKLGTWLYRIALNEAINYSKRMHEDSALEDADEVVKNLSADPYFDGDDVQLRLQDAIAMLPEKQRLVFNLRYFDEMNYNDMSRLLDTSVGALKASYHHAVRKIIAFFRKED